MALRKSTKLHKIKKVKSIIKEDISKVDKKYKTTYKDIKMYFTMINELVFDNKLSPFNKVLIKQLRHKTEKIYGQVLTYDWDRTGAREYQLHMIPYYKNKKDFACTLAHEMVHLYQMANEGDTGNHNQLFYSYRSKLNKIGLDL
jgi:hypothetical protein|tara:strand:- start:143 stop:574 length:432 start_codon:yes stop_codon:yes gene_type:complete